MERAAPGQGGVRREARVRRALRRKGEFLRKYRTRRQDIDRLYMIVNSSNWIVDGANFELTWSRSRLTPACPARPTESGFTR